MGVDDECAQHSILREISVTDKPYLSFDEDGSDLDDCLPPVSASVCSLKFADVTRSFIGSLRPSPVRDANQDIHSDGYSAPMGAFPAIPQRLGSEGSG